MTQTMRARLCRAMLDALDKQGVGGGIGWDVQHGDAGGPAQVEECDPEAVVDAILAELSDEDFAYNQAENYDGQAPTSEFARFFTAMIDAIRTGDET